MIWLVLGLSIWASLGLSFYAGCIGVAKRADEVIPGSKAIIGEVGSVWKYMLTGPCLPVYILIFHAGE